MRRFTSGTPSKWTMIVEIAIGVALLPVNIGLILHAEGIGDAIGISLSLTVSAAFYYRLVKNYLRVYGTRNKNCPARVPEDTARKLADPHH